ncbi:SpaH/EbpB family LPXTG-anchored major pilin [Mobiluncus curtisii]|uniref:SpaH/EbpB family LPXTG-anchored major pilin n=1 Tax=Mobiluncus curtisii TaxID=2051 RepID=UPI0014707D13|nr:SpaH/EbpB family LPXTG-anchored major pilin [Mobiluncus curtisii]NMW44383.1 SpaH/EbpB family LPXTG-anchored major pilin [Mobiluncus curtisii]NMW98547.1 SpaH/EbpB family LPXTG-anchored major pilin [Mobiluncus curtisii]NMX06109.1 SpaH/EbpB family LPXTG-anchored major pilin [Mobiluncus curtisii]
MRLVNMKSIGIPIWRRTVAIFATGAVALLGAAGMLNAPAASAAPIDGSATGSITVHALTMPTAGGAQTATGMVQTPPTGATAIQGAAFKLEKSTINITTNQGYSEALALTAASFGSTDSDFGAKTGTTGSDGSFTFSNLKPGVYRLTQTAAPEGKTLMAPAVVFVPMTDPANTANWVYDIHVYPKNGDASKIKKTDITPAGTPITVGSTMTWQMDVPIPDIDTNDTFATFKVQDLPTNMKATIVSSVTIDPEHANTGLTAGNANDYTVATDSPTANQLEVTFTPNGLTKINAAKGKTMRLIVKTEVLNSVNTTDGVTNAAKAIYTTANGGGGETTIVSDPDNPAKTTFGKLKILNENATGTKLSGAKFKIYQCAGDPLGTKTTGNALTIGANSEFEITDAANGVIVGPLGATEGELCLVQTKAPDGYQQLAGPQKFEFTKAKITGAAGNTLEVTVKNTSTSSITGLLPNTGGKGIILFVIVGLVLLGGAAVYMRRQRS